jgi:serine/threonine protein kinase
VIRFEKVVLVLIVSLKNELAVLTNNEGGGGCSLLSSFAKHTQAIFQNYRNFCVKSTGESYESVQLSDRLLKTLNQKNSLLSTLKSVSTDKHSKTQASKAQAADFLQDSVFRLLFRGKSLTLNELEGLANQLLRQEYTDLYPTKESTAYQVKLKQYIHKAAPSALKWLNKNSDALQAARQGIRQYLSKSKQESGAPRLDRLMVQTERDIGFALDLNLSSGSALPRSVLNAIVQQELDTVPVEMQDGTKIYIPKVCQQEKGDDWVNNTLPVLVKSLEDNIREDVQKIRNHPAIRNDHSDWDDVIQNHKLTSQLTELFSNPKRSQLGADFPDIIHQVSQKILTEPENYRVVYTTTKDQLVELSGSYVKERGKEWRTNTFQKEAEDLENEVTAALLKISDDDFKQSDQPSPYNAIRNTLRGQFQMHNELAKAYPELLDAILDAGFAKKEAVDGPRLFYNAGFQPSPIHFKGGYLKKATDSQNNGNLFQNTRVKAASGNVYELLNTLTEADSDALLAQHGMERKGKTVLGEGAYGRVRLARDVRTGDLLAVKKFQPKEQSGKNKRELPETLADVEIEQFGLVSDQLANNFASTGSETLASIRDYAHVGKATAQALIRSPIRSPIRRMLSPLRKSVDEGSSNQAKQLVGKSYIFMDLANQGDGNEEIARINTIQGKGNMPEAYRRCINVAVQYAQAVADMHKLLLTHRDIKPANFLHTKNPETGVEQAKLSDFGFVLDADHHNRYAGRTPSYTPPEARDSAHNQYYAPAHDAFSLGVVLFKLRNAAVGDSPLNLQFKSEEKEPSLELVRESGIDMNTVVLQENHLDSLIAELLNKDMNSRISPEDAYQKLLTIQAESLK